MSDDTLRMDNVGSERRFEVSIAVKIFGFGIKETKMLQLAITCLIIALIAAILGFGGIAGSFVGIAKILFLYFSSSPYCRFSQAGCAADYRGDLQPLPEDSA